MNFPNTIGHQKQKDFFTNAISHGKLAHAYALVGPEHIGKTTFALEMAQSLVGSSVFDLIVLDSSEEIGIEQVRQVQARLSLSAAGG